MTKLLLNLACSLVGHPEALSSETMERFRAEMRRTAMRSELRGERLTVQISCACGRRMVSVDLWPE